MKRLKHKKLMLRPTLTEVAVATPLGVKLSVTTMMLGAVALLAGLVVGFGLESEQAAVPPAPIGTSLSRLASFDVQPKEPFVPNHLLVQVKPGRSIDGVIDEVLAKAVPTLPQGESTPTEIESTTTASAPAIAPTVVRKNVVYKTIPAELPTDGSQPTSGIPGELVDLEFSGTGFDPVAYARAFSASSGVAFAEPNYYVHLFQVSPNDPFFSSVGSWGQPYKDLWGLEKMGFTADGQSSAWDIQKGSAEQVVAVIDTGVDYTHEDLADRMWVNAGEDRNVNGKVDGELFSDTGVDGRSDFYEVGWDSGSNPDPKKDNYDVVTNPSGTEGDRKYSLGEPYADCGLDGICKDDPRYVAADADGTEGNGRYDAGDFDFIDNDKNGYVDDIRGWDFAGEGLSDDASLESTDPIRYDNNPMDSYGHGSHIAGTIAASTNNSRGMAGINRNIRILPVKAFFDASGSTTVSMLAIALRYAADNGAKVANASWGAPFDTTVLHDSVRYAYSKGMVIVAAAGNSAIDLTGTAPAGFAEVITVSAFDQNDAPAYFTNFGGKIDVAAPGGGSGHTGNEVYTILSVLARNSVFATDPNLAPYRIGTKYIRIAGTSMAAPHVAGAASLLTSQHPDWTIEQVRQALRTSATDVHTTGFDVYAGFGRVNATKALAVEDPIGVHITAPIPGATFVSTDAPLDILGTVQGSNLATYTLSLGKGDVPTAWTTLATGGQGGVNGVLLGSYKFSDLAKGTYVLRLAAIAKNGKVYEDRLTFVKTLPSHKGWPVDTHDLFLSASSPTITDIDGVADGKNEIVLQGLGFAIQGSGAITYMYREDGTPLPGWPQTTNASPALEPACAELTPAHPGKECVMVIGQANTGVQIFNALGASITQPWTMVQNTTAYAVTDIPKIADTNADGKEEVVTSSNFGFQAWNPNATSASPFVYQYTNADEGIMSSVGNFNATKAPEIFSTRNALHTFANTTVPLPGFLYLSGSAADVDNDGIQEIFAISNNYLYAYHGDGRPLAGQWPVAIKDAKALQYHAILTPSIGDITGDSATEVVYMSPTAIYAFDLQGALLPGWPVNLALGEATPILADVDGDSKNDVIFNTLLGTVHALNGAGKEIDGWPIRTGTLLLNAPAVKDIDADGDNEVIIASGFMDDLGRIFVFDTPGKVAAWPMRWQNERNTNAQVLSLKEARAELVSSFPAFAPFQDVSATLEKPYTFTTVVGNTGAVPATNVVVQVFDGKKGSGGTQIGVNTVVPKIDPGQTLTLQHAITFTRLAQAGSHTLYAYVDPDNVVPETFESNVASRQLYVEDYQLGSSDLLTASAFETTDLDASFMVGGSSTSGPVVLVDLNTKVATTLSLVGKNPKLDKNRIVWIEGTNLMQYDMTTKVTSKVYATTPAGVLNFDVYDHYLSVFDSNWGSTSLRLHDLITKKSVRITPGANGLCTPVIWNGQIVYNSGPYLYLYDIASNKKKELPYYSENIFGCKLALLGDTLFFIEQYNDRENYKDIQKYVYVSIDLRTLSRTEHWLPFIASDATPAFTPIDEHALLYQSKIYDFRKGSKESSTILLSGTGPTNASYVRKLDNTQYIVSVTTPTVQTFIAQWSRVNHAPYITPMADKTVTVKTNLAFTVQATDLDNDVLSYSSSNLPIGATLNKTTGAFSWTPQLLVIDEISGTATTSVSFTATDSKGASSQLTVKITVTAAPTCFAAGTMITRADGTTTPIEQLQVGDIVMAYDEITGQLRPARVARTFTHTTNEALRMNGNLAVTPNHPMLANGKWVEAGLLAVGDTLTTATGVQRIRTIERQHGTLPVYNLEVSPFHTYIANGFVVHNKLAPPQPLPVNEVGI